MTITNTDFRDCLKKEQTTDVNAFVLVIINACFTVSIIPMYDYIAFYVVMRSIHTLNCNTVTHKLAYLTYKHALE